MVGWHHRLNGHEFAQAPGDGNGQGSVVCCSPWGHKESDTTEQLSNNNKEKRLGFPEEEGLLPPDCLWTQDSTATLTRPLVWPPSLQISDVLASRIT